MKYIIFISLLFSIFVTSKNFAFSLNLNCVGKDFSKWDGCRGAVAKSDSTYVGHFNNGLMNGFGTFTYSDGATYVGEFKNDKEHGEGTFICWNHGSKYIGEFVNGKKQGYGTYFFPDGVKYEGMWFDGLKHGKGTLTYKDGNKLVGEFKNGKFIDN